MSSASVVPAAVLIALTAACSSPLGRREGAPAATASPRDTAPAQGAGAPTLDHLTPRRDSVGEMPARFAWTPIEGADFYAVGIYSEIGMLVWQHPEVRTASLDWTEKVRLDPGTYFWAVTAFRSGQPVAESGRAAFVVK